MSGNLALAPEEIERALVRALAKKTNASARRPSLPREYRFMRFDAWFGFGESADGSTGWYWTSDVSGKLVTRRGGDTAEECEAALRAYVASVLDPVVAEKREAEIATSRWSPPGYGHLEWAFCPACDGPTSALPGGAQVMCWNGSCAWSPFPTSVRSPYSHTHPHRVWLGAVASAIRGEPQTRARYDYDRTAAWDAGWSFGCARVGRPSEDPSSSPLIRRERLVDEDRVAADKHLARMRRVGRRLTVDEVQS